MEIEQLIKKRNAQRRRQSAIQKLVQAKSVHQHVCSYLNIDDLKNLRLVTKGFNKMCEATWFRKTVLPIFPETLIMCKRCERIEKACFAPTVINMQEVFQLDLMEFDSVMKANSVSPLPSKCNFKIITYSLKHLLPKHHFWKTIGPKIDYLTIARNPNDTSLGLMYTLQWIMRKCYNLTGIRISDDKFNFKDALCCRCEIKIGRSLPLKGEGSSEEKVNLSLQVDPLSSMVHIGKSEAGLFSEIFRNLKTLKVNSNGSGVLNVLRYTTGKPQIQLKRLELDETGYDTHYDELAEYLADFCPPLECLRITVHCTPFATKPELIEQLLLLCPGTNLKKLQLNGYVPSKFPNEPEQEYIDITSFYFPLLTHLCLSGKIHFSLAAATKMKNLKVLQMSTGYVMFDVTSNDSDNQLLQLEHLRLIGCPKQHFLTEMKTVAACTPNLELLVIEFGNCLCKESQKNGGVKRHISGPFLLYKATLAWRYREMEIQTEYAGATDPTEVEEEDVEDAEPVENEELERGEKYNEEFEGGDKYVENDDLGEGVEYVEDWELEGGEEYVENWELEGGEEYVENWEHMEISTCSLPQDLHLNEGLEGGEETVMNEGLEGGEECVRNEEHLKENEGLEGGEETVMNEGLEGGEETVMNEGLEGGEECVRNEEHLRENESSEVDETVEAVVKALVALKL